MRDTAAFFRVEGALLDRSGVRAAAWLAARSQELSLRVTRLGAIAASAPFTLGGDPVTAARIAWSALRGMSEDRLVVLGEEYWETALRARILPLGRDLLERARAEGRRVVLLGDHVEVIGRHLAEHLRADEYVFNRLELRDGRVTGRLEDPVVGRLGGRWLTTFAAERGIDLRRSTAYGAVEADAPLLSAIGLPCAIHPDRALRRVARDLDWPVVEG